MRFPILVFGGNSIYVYHSIAELSSCTASALKNNYFASVEIVDSEMRLYRVLGTRRISSPSFLQRLNPFRINIIRVSLHFSESSPAELAYVRQRALESLEQREGWRTRGDYDLLQSAVTSASSVADFIRIFDWQAEAREGLRE